MQVMFQVNFYLLSIWKCAIILRQFFNRTYVFFVSSFSMLWCFFDCKRAKKAVFSIFSISLSQVHNRILHEPISGVKERRIPSWGISIIQGFLFLSTFSRGHLWEVLLFKDSYIWEKFSTTKKHFEGDMSGFAALS